jgi:hypothetical protein
MMDAGNGWSGIQPVYSHWLRIARACADAMAYTVMV